MKRTIHVLEDDVDISELIALLLTEQGYEVVISYTIATFRKQVSEPLPALIILDIMLPDGNGLDVCQAWKANAETRHVPILLMSAYENFKHDIRAKEANGFISKPFDIRVFLTAVQQQINSWF